MQQLSLIDSLFLYAEDTKMPMHIGSLYIMAADDEAKEFNFEDFKTFLQERIHLNPVYRRRLLETPLNIGYPYWIDDPDFNLDNHLFHLALPKKGTRSDLLQMIADIYNQPLDRSQPLWSNTIITGLANITSVPKNAFAMVVKVHHANIDGLAGIEMQKTIFDFEPIPRKVTPPNEKWNPDYLASIPKKIIKDYKDKTLQFPEKVFDFLNTTTQAFTQTKKTGITTQQIAKEFLNSTAPLSLFNQAVTPSKVFGLLNIPFAKVKAIKDQTGVKLNDVILAICGGGISRYLVEKNALPAKSIVAGVPISLRNNEQKSDMGNQISMMRVELETNERSEIKRLEKIHQRTKNSKIIAKAAPIDKITALIPSEIAAAAAKIYTHIGALSKYALTHNVIITNIPGTPAPIFMNGFRTIYQYGLGLTMENMGLMISVLSLEKTISITLTACASMVDDPQVLAEYIRFSLKELERELQAKHEETNLFQTLADKYQLSDAQKTLL